MTKWSLIFFCSRSSSFLTPTHFNQESSLHYSALASTKSIVPISIYLNIYLQIVVRDLLLGSGLCQKLSSNVLSLGCLSKSFYVTELKYSQVYKVQSILAMPACKICPHCQSLSHSAVFIHSNHGQALIVGIKSMPVPPLLLSLPLVQYNITQCGRLPLFPVPQDSECSSLLCLLLLLNANQAASKLNCNKDKNRKAQRQGQNRGRQKLVIV